jgi:hypothetical protein
LAFGSASAPGQKEPGQPTLNETLAWLKGATDAESHDGNNHHTFESKSNSSCSVVITETRNKAGLDFWIKESFSLADIDPSDILVDDLGKGPYTQMFQGLSSVVFHTTNYRKKILHTSNSTAEAIPTSDYTFFTNVGFAPRFAKALKRAAELCGAKPSSF